MRFSEFHKAQYVYHCEIPGGKDPDGRLIQQGEPLYYVWEIERPYRVGQIVSEQWCTANELITVGVKR